MIDLVREGRRGWSRSIRGTCPVSQGYYRHSRDLVEVVELAALERRRGSDPKCG